MKSGWYLVFDVLYFEAMIFHLSQYTLNMMEIEVRSNFKLLVKYMYVCVKFTVGSVLGSEPIEAILNVYTYWLYAQSELEHVNICLDDWITVILLSKLTI